MNKGVFKNNLFSSKRGQITIFLIIALIVIAVGITIYFLSKDFNAQIEFDDKNPKAFIQNCLEDRIKEVTETVSLQGGKINPELFFKFDEVPINYLCYTNKNFQTCTIQQPLLKNSIENEIAKDIEPDVKECFNSLKENYENRGYGVDMQTGVTLVELLPKRVVSKFNYVFSVSKEETRRFENFNVVLNNNLYELQSIAMSIVNFEKQYGDADPRIYMTIYPDLKVEKNSRDDGTKIYVITDRNNQNKFQFASKSLVTLPGY